MKYVSSANNKSNKMKYITTQRKRGFTLIELLVVISIIGLLASVVLASLNTARAKARDAKKISEVKQINTALQLYWDTNKAYPLYGSIACSASSIPLEVNTWNLLMNALVGGGFLASAPVSPEPGASGTGGGAYCYYNYVVGTSGIPALAAQQRAAGAMIMVNLEAAPVSTTGYGGCRPFIGATWCSSDSSQYYCLCNVQ